MQNTTKSKLLQELWMQMLQEYQTSQKQPCNFGNVRFASFQHLTHFDTYNINKIMSKIQILRKFSGQWG